MRLVFAIVFLMLGLAFPLVLNGQTFTNSLLGLAGAGLAAVMALGPAWRGRPKASLGRARTVVAGLAALLSFALVVQLPSAYRFQAGFNRRSEAAREKVRQGKGGKARVGSVVPPAIGT